MPWLETCPMEERMKFVLAYETEGDNMSALCRRFGVSRKTGYKWVRRFGAKGVAGLVDLSRSPHSHPHAVDPLIEEAVVHLRKSWPTWGPKKLRAHLKRFDLGGRPLPAASTVARILKRNGLVRPPKRRRRTPPYVEPFEGCGASNEVWCADFKGQFKTGRKWCYPLTIMDAYSRYLLRCEALERARSRNVKQVFESAFREFGLPRAIRTDNGAPFASKGLLGLSRLSVWWVRLGVRPERIEPGKPQQNGRHERMHRTLKQETASPPCSSLRAQQRCFDRFRRDYNEVRPHEALELHPPALVYRPSDRLYREREPPPQYTIGVDVLKVSKEGTIPWRGKVVYISTAFVGEWVGVADLEEGSGWEVLYSDLTLGYIDRKDCRRKGSDRVLLHDV